MNVTFFVKGEEIDTAEISVVPHIGEHVVFGDTAYAVVDVEYRFTHNGVFVAKVILV